MAWYEFLLFLHIAGAVVWVGGAAMMQFFGLRTVASGSGERLAAGALSALLVLPQVRLTHTSAS